VPPCTSEHCCISLHICVVSLVTDLGFLLLGFLTVILKYRCSVRFVVWILLSMKFLISVVQWVDFRVVGFAHFYYTNGCPVWSAHLFFAESQSYQLIYYYSSVLCLSMVKSKSAYSPSVCVWHSVHVICFVITCRINVKILQCIQISTFLCCFYYFHCIFYCAIFVVELHYVLSMF
jgi:hypothetical protein